MHVGVMLPSAASFAQIWLSTPASNAKSPPPDRALRLTYEFPRMTHRANLMMGSLCSMRFATMPQKNLRGLGHFYSVVLTLYHKKTKQDSLVGNFHMTKQDIEAIIKILLWITF